MRYKNANPHFLLAKHKFKMKRIFSDFAISALRVWLFTPRTLDIFTSDFGEFPVEGQTANLDKLALRIFLYAYACSSWTKASCYLQQRRPHLLNPFHQQIGYIHLILGSYLIKQTRQTVIQLIPTGQLSNLAGKILKLFAIGLTIDELVTFVYLYFFELKRTVTGMPGYGACMICLDDPIENGLKICKAGHVSHKRCIEKWYNPYLENHKTCPACRQEMTISIAYRRNFTWTPKFLSKVGLRISLNTAALILMTALYFLQATAFKWRLRQIFRHLKSPSDRDT